MSRTTIIILILIALGVFIYVINKQKEAKTQDELLNSMSNEELTDLANSVSPPGTLIDPGQSREILIAIIKRHQNG